MRVAYNANVLPSEAFALLSSHKDSFLIDVRTASEWLSTGIPDLSSIHKEVTLISWKVLPDMRIAADFLTQFEKAIPNKESFVFLICRSGFRSAEAADFISSSGNYKNVYNILHGFVDENSGWKKSNLPWKGVMSL